MIEPERLTIEVLVIGDGQYFLREVRGKYNKLPSQHSMEIIGRWFAHAVDKL